VKTFSVRKPLESENVSADLSLERACTIYLLPPYPYALVSAHFHQLLRSPKAYLSAFAFAYKNCPLGIRNMARQLAYFAEAALLTREMTKQSLFHLHNH